MLYLPLNRISAFEYYSLRLVHHETGFSMMLLCNYIIHSFNNIISTFDNN